MILTILAVLGIVIAAFLLVALGIKIANHYNKVAWEKYYEGAAIAVSGVKQPQRSRSCPR